MAAWIGSLYSLEPLTDDGDLQAILFVAFSFAAGLIANRWWVVIVPFVLLTSLFTYDGTNTCNECRDELAGLGQLLLGLMLAVAAAIPIALGVAVRRLAARVRRGYSSRARNAL